jgi:glycerophosphoryl diester phosphodiesterase
VLTETDLDLALAFAKFIRAQSIHPYFHLLTAATQKRERDSEFSLDNK